MAACDKPSPGTNPAPHEEKQSVASDSPHPSDSILYLRFLATGETFYRELKLENKMFSYTYFEDTEHRCEQWVQSRPCWMEDDLKTITQPLSAKEIESLYTAISNSGILDITESKLGGAKTGQRFYAERLEIHMGAIEKTIIYQSFPEAIPKPKAFQIMEEAMENFANKLPR